MANRHAQEHRAWTETQKQGIIEQLYALWLQYPKLRLMQLIGNVYPDGAYHVEDFDFIEALEVFYQGEQSQEGKHCACGNILETDEWLCSTCRSLLGTREFEVGQRVRIIRRETWTGDICTITGRNRQNPNMYWLCGRGWRRCDEIELVEKGKEG